MNREKALELLGESVQKEALAKHMLAVEAAMRFYGEKLGEDVERWGLVGLLHDFDYELFPDPPGHTREGAKILRDKGVDEEIVGCILSHADWNLEEYPRNTPIRQVLFAVDELCGFLVACALVRPERLRGMKASSVKKKLKSRGFAAAVSRADIQNGAEQLGVPLDEHIGNCISALQTVAGPLGLEI